LRDQLHALLENFDLGIFKLIEYITASLCIDETLGLHQIEEALYGILLLDPVKPYYRILPLSIKPFILLSLFLDLLFIVGVISSVLYPVSLVLMRDPVLYQLIYLGGKEESDIHKVLTH